MVDLSDGLSADLGHLLRESSQALGKPLGAVLDEKALMSLPGLRQASKESGISPLTACLVGGDDYELAFAAKSTVTAQKQLEELRKRTSVPIKRVGRVTEGRGLWVDLGHGDLRKTPQGGWSHF
jgi:thiamine-monophosphate kinase